MRSAMQIRGVQMGTLFFLLVAFLLMSGRGHGADNLTFKGNLVAEACTLRPGDEALELDMEEVSSRELYSNSRTMGRRFEIHLEDCDTDTADSVTTTFSGVENMALPGLLALDAWRNTLFVSVFVIAVLSGVQYVWIWGSKARRERAAGRLKLR